MEISEITEAIKGLGEFSGPVVAALIAGVISCVLTILAKDQKTSEFRQAWIDGLRADIAEFVGINAAMVSILKLRKAKGENTDSYLLQRHEDFTSLEVLLSKIMLRLNPKEHVKVIGLLERFVDGKSESPDELEALLNDLIQSVQKILKQEWKRVKRGEFSYIALKWGSMVIVVVLLVVIGLYVYG